MTSSSIQETSLIGRQAARLLADYDACTPGTVFAEHLELDLPQAYALQSEVAELRRRRGERVVGYKVGCTSPIIRAQLGIDHCVAGRLYDSERHASDAALSRKKYANLAIEGELAVELSRSPVAGDFSGDRVPACVARVFPVIELHNLVLRMERPSAGELVANNALHAGFVAGCGVDPGGVVGPPALAIFCNDRLLDRCDGRTLVETIHQSLKWLAEFTGDRGDRLGPGQIVLTGSILSLIPICEDCRITVDTSPFGGVAATFSG